MRYKNEFESASVDNGSRDIFYIAAPEPETLILPFGTFSVFLAFSGK